MSTHPNARERNRDPVPEFLGQGPAGLKRQPERVAGVQRREEAPPLQPVELESLEEPKRNRLNEIAYLVGSLSYGEMIQLAAELWGCRGDDINDLDKVWHRWSKGRK